MDHTCQADPWSEDARQSESIHARTAIPLDALLCSEEGQIQQDLRRHGPRFRPNFRLLAGGAALDDLSLLAFVGERQAAYTTTAHGFLPSW